jgi:hypothetical protein
MFDVLLALGRIALVALTAPFWISLAAFVAVKIFAVAVVALLVGSVNGARRALETWQNRRSTWPAHRQVAGEPAGPVIRVPRTGNAHARAQRRPGPRSGGRDAR